MPGYVGAALHSFQHKKPQNIPGITIPLDTTHPLKKQQMLSEKAPSEKLDDNNNKIRQKIVGKFLYYARSVDPTMMMALN